MKTVRIKISKWFDRLDQRWKALPVAKQQIYTLCFFAGYVLLNAGVIFKAGSDNDMEMKHIENTALKKKESPAVIQDSLIKILKNKNYERK